MGYFVACPNQETWGVELATIGDPIALPILPNPYRRKIP